MPLTRQQAGLRAALIILVGLLYASAILGARFIISHIHPLTYVAVRLSAGAVFFALLLAAGVGGRRFPKDGLMWRQGILVGIFGDAASTVLINASLLYQSSGITTILSTLTPAVLLILAHFFLRDEKLTRVKTLGILLAFSGAALIALRGESGLSGVERVDPRGPLFILGAILAGSFTVIYMRKYLVSYDPVEFTAIRIIAAGVVLLPAALLTTGIDLSPLPTSGKLILAYNTLNLCATAVLTFYLVKLFDATSYSLVDYVTTILATLGGVLLLREQVTGGILTGMLLILAGVAFINRQAKTNPPAQS